MFGDTYDVDGEGRTDQRRCTSCGENYNEPVGLKADAGECPSCSGGDLS